MFDAPEPIYDELYEYMKRNFLKEDPLNRDDPKPLVRFERGIIYETYRNVNKSNFPMGYLEWGEIGEVENYQSPNGYKYNLIYRLCLLTFQKDGEPENAVFTKKTGAGFYGIGDLVTTIVRKFWADHKKSRFISARTRYDSSLVVSGDTLASDETDWWIIDWTLGVPNSLESQPGETDMIPAGGSRQNNPLVRGTQININFQVFERDVLI